MLRLLLISILFLSLHAEYVSINIDSNRTKSTIALPYVFSSDSSGLTAGVVGIMSGYGQKNLTVVATAFTGELLHVEKHGQSNTDKAHTQGFFLGMYSYYPNQQVYIDGSNDSNKEHVFRTQGFNNWLELPISYTLPWGSSADEPITVYKLKNGLVVNRYGYGGGLPFITGSTSMEFKPFYNKWSADKLLDEPAWSTNGTKLTLKHDNTDYISNPSTGYKFNIEYAHDFGRGNSTQSWNAVTASYSHYINLENLSFSRQSQLAFNVWSSYSPSWDNNNLHPGTTVNAHRPPPWEGASLGGWDRLRAYDSNRFSDKAAIYYGLEHRIIPTFNPLKKQNWLPISIDWFQLVTYVEIGRVAPEYNVKALHTDMKYDVGFSLRALAASVPVRFEMAYGLEGMSMWVMVKQPF